MAALKDSNRVCIDDTEDKEGDYLVPENIAKNIFDRAYAETLMKKYDIRLVDEGNVKDFAKDFAQECISRPRHVENRITFNNHTHTQEEFDIDADTIDTANQANQKAIDMIQDALQEVEINMEFCDLRKAHGLLIDAKMLLKANKE